MCCHVRSASVSHRRRQPHRLSAPPLPLAVLDLSQPGQRQAHEFLCRATSKHDRMWELLDVRRQEDLLLCVVRWVYPDDAGKPYALAELSLTEAAVCWRDHASADAARSELERRCSKTAPAVPSRRA